MASILQFLVVSLVLVTLATSAPNQEALFNFLKIRRCTEIEAVSQDTQGVVRLGN